MGQKSIILDKNSDVLRREPTKLLIVMWAYLSPEKKRKLLRYAYTLSSEKEKALIRARKAAVEQADGSIAAVRDSGPEMEYT